MEANLLKLYRTILLGDDMDMQVLKTVLDGVATLTSSPPPVFLLSQGGKKSKMGNRSNLSRKIPVILL